MYRLYPRISKPTASRLATDRAKLDVIQLITLSEDFTHPEVWFAPTGGNRVDNTELAHLQQSTRNLAGEFGYPAPVANKDVGDFDKHLGQFLHEEMGIYPAEAANIEMWFYLTTILLPDVVRWRFFRSDGGTSLERYIGSARGLRRNMFGRLWWRAHLFYYAQNPDDPYLLLGVLSEDDQIQISERPSISGNPRLAKEIAISYLTIQRVIQRNHIEVERRMVLRDALKRISRILPITMLDMLDETESQQVFDDIFRASLAWLTKQT